MDQLDKLIEIKITEFSWRDIGKKFDSEKIWYFCSEPVRKSNVLTYKSALVQRDKCAVEQFTIKLNNLKSKMAKCSKEKDAKKCRKRTGESIDYYNKQLNKAKEKLQKDSSKL